MTSPTRSERTGKSVSTIGSLILAIACITLAALASPAQTAAPKGPTQPSPANTPYQPTMTFDVASVRENKSFDINQGITMSSQFTSGATSLQLINWDIENLVSFAFGIHEYQIAGAPNWPWPTIFVIRAKGDSDADAKIAALPKAQQEAEQQHMLQVLMEDRFKLKTHWETKEGTTDNLVIAKGEPKLRVAAPTPPSTDESKTHEHPEPELYQKNDGAGYDFIAHSCPIDQLVTMLAAMFNRPVIDKTGLTGKYNFVIRYKGQSDRDRSPDDPDPLQPLDRALQDQLGLKLEPAKGPIPILVIDHIEKPSEN